MARIVTLDAHDPLPEGHGIVVLTRMDEDAPDKVMHELIVTNPDHSEETARFDSLDAALAAAQARATEEGLDEITQLDRTAGPREHAILDHHGDHGFDSAKLDDFDEEDGVRGTDMRDRGNDGAPRRF